MTDRDPSLDMALRLLGSADPATGTDDDARFVKRVAGALGKKLERKDIDAALGAPLPDDHRDPTPEAHDAIEEAEIVDERDAALAAEDHRGEDRAWDGAISRPPVSAVSAIDGMRELTRSGPHPSIRPASDEIGMAKGPDSGLIDLRGLSQSGEKPIAEGADPNAPDLSRTTPQSPAALKPVASGATSAKAPSSAAASAKTARRGNPGLWLGGAGLAAAAALAIFFVSTKRSDAPSSSQRSADVAAAKANASSNTTPAATIAATTTESPSYLASASAAPDDQASALPDDPAANAPGPSDDKLALGTKKAPPKSPTGSGVGPKDVAKPTSTATGTPATPQKTGNGSLDDVLGLNKPAVPTATISVTPDLPDKPETMDIRTAVNGKLGAANACVAGLSGASKVQISFSPAGTVSGVVVTSGPAKGTGAEACIKGAFSSAKVPRSKFGGTGSASLGS